jgi:large subunit ribosomal protein L29
MAVMDIGKMRELSDNELEDALRQAKQDLWSARFALSTRQLNDTSTIPQTRRAIARILTVQRERGTGPAAVAPAPAAPKARASTGKTPAAAGRKSA